MMKRRTTEVGQNSLPTSHSPTKGTSISFSPTTVSTLRINSKCILELFKMKHMFVTLPQSESVEEVQGKVLDIKYSVVCWLEELFKVTEEDGQTPLPTSHSPPSVMVEGSSSYFPTTSTACSSISDCIKKLLRMRRGIVHMSISDSERDIIDKVQHEILRLKSSVASRLETLFKETEENAMDVDGYESSDEYEDDVAPFFVRDPAKHEKQLRWFFKEAFRWSGVTNDKEINEKERYLCVSNGYEIWCLDLSKSLSYPPVLPKITTLNLLGDQLPASVGLFKFGSDAYLIGGKKLPASLEGPLSRIQKYSYGKITQGMKLYSFLSESLGTQGSSRVTYCLSLAADMEEEGTLGLSHPKADTVPELNKPKVWPIVENIGGKLHVMDSLPELLLGYRDWTFTHEVYNPGDGWKEIPTIEKDWHIHSHVVVGDHIYAVACSESGERRFLVFDSKTGKWEGCSEHKPLHSKTKSVWDVIEIGFARCAVESQHPHGGEPLYAIVALETDYRSSGPRHAMIATAYLVRLTGEVVCYQRLPDFFTGPLQPCGVLAGTVIHVDGEEEGPARTMCSVVSGLLRQDDKQKDYLFVNTFSVELLNPADFGRRLVKKASEVEDGVPVEIDFVRVVPKDWYVFETDGKSKGEYGYHLGRFLGWRACFLTPP